MRTYSLSLAEISQQGVKTELVSSALEAFKAMPRAIHAHYLTPEATLWSSLQPENLTISAADLTLKYGGEVPGVWQILCVLDAWAETTEPDTIEAWSAGPLMDGILTATRALRATMGRPAQWLGITPLMIFRDIAGWYPGVAGPTEE